MVFLLLVIGRLNQTPMENQDLMVIDIQTLEELQQLDLMSQEQRLARRDRQARNIAVNQAEDNVERYEDYQNYRLSNRAVEQEARKRAEKTIDDIIRENELNPDDREIPAIESKQLDFYEARKMEEEQVYQGPTNIYYNLKDREVVYLHIPVYKCQGGGTVQVDIRVGKRGKVELVTINSEGTDTRDPCFLDAAKDAARRTRFNFSSPAPQLQSGYIIYHFVAQ
jgi:hypothetical protein